MSFRGVMGQVRRKKALRKEQVRTDGDRRTLSKRGMDATERWGDQNKKLLIW